MRGALRGVVRLRSRGATASVLTPSVPKRQLQNPGWLYRRITSWARVVPDFIIIGAPRSGTTSLYHYLVEHAAVAPAFRKELYFFDTKFARGLRWYRANFPSVLHKRYIRWKHRGQFATGEATPHYFEDPAVPSRVRQLLPNVKLVALLRNPVDRAYSHYQRRRRLGLTLPTFEETLRNHPRFLLTGVYVDILKVWRNSFPQEQLLVLRSEDLFQDPPAVLRQVLSFLGLSMWEPARYAKWLEGDYPPMDASLRRWLVEYYRPHNQRLYEYLGRDMEWDA